MAYYNKDAAQHEYNTAQANLETFNKDNQVDMLNARLTESKALFNAFANDRSNQITYYDKRRQDLEALIDQAGALQKQLQNGATSTTGSLGVALAAMGTHFSALGVTQKCVIP